MRKFDWRKYIYKAAIVILVTFFVVGVGFGAKKILTIEGVREMYTAPAPLSQMPETGEEMIGYINAAVEKALHFSPKTELSSAFSVDRDSVNVSDGNKQFLSAVQMAVPAVNAGVTDRFEKRTADFSESSADFLTSCRINAADITDAKLEYEYYKCSLCTSEIAYDRYSEVCPEWGCLMRGSPK